MNTCSTYFGPVRRWRRKISNAHLSRLLPYLLLTGIGLLIGQSCWQHLKIEATTGARSLNRPSPLNYTPERYELMGKYDQESLSQIDPPFKRILFWNEAYGSKDYNVGIGRHALRKWGCPVWQCETSDNRNHVQDYDAVVFHLRSWSRNDLPQRRSPHQRYIGWIMESAAWREYMVDNSPMVNFFNWTFSYRWDSDIVSPYGYVKPVHGRVPLHPHIS